MQLLDYHLAGNRYYEISVALDNEYMLTVPPWRHVSHWCHCTSLCAQNDLLMNVQTNGRQTSTVSKLTDTDCIQQVTTTAVKISKFCFATVQLSQQFSNQIILFSRLHL